MAGRSTQLLERLLAVSAEALVPVAEPERPGRRRLRELVGGDEDEVVAETVRLRELHRLPIPVVPSGGG